MIRRAILTIRFGACNLSEKSITLDDFAERMVTHRSYELDWINWDTAANELMKFYQPEPAVPRSVGDRIGQIAQRIKDAWAILRGRAQAEYY